MKVRRKVKHCLNCNALLNEVYNFCPMCGQENNDNNVSFITLINDFFSNYFAFDSKLAKTVVPFFTRPGFITNRYIEGKRVSYAHPLRMYLIISLFYFFIWTLIAKDLVKDSQPSNLIELNADPEPEDVFNAIDSASMGSIREAIPPESVRKIDSMMMANDSVSYMRALRRFTTQEEREKIAELLTPKDTTGTQLREDTSVTQLPGDTKLDIPEVNVLDSIEVDTTRDDSFTQDESFVLFRMDYQRLNRLSKNRELTDQQVLDSLDLGEMTAMESRVARQTIRISRADKEGLIGFIVKNLPIMMLLLIPFFALILKLLYVRSPYLYFNHVIHGLHLHSFAYLIYGLTMILTYFVIQNEGISSTINVIAFIGVTTYCYFSFLRVYKQGWFKTLIKFNINGFIYITLIFFFLLGELFISLFLY